MSYSLRQAVANGMFWLLVQSVGSRIVSFGCQLLLAKMLSPEIFGVVGVALTVINIANVLAAACIDQLLQKRAKFITLWLSNALALVLLSSTAVTICMSVIFFALLHFDMRTLAFTLLFYWPSVPLTACSLISQTVLQRDFRFRFLSSYNFVEALLLQALTIIMVLCGLETYSFALAASAVALLRLVIFWYQSPLSSRSPLRPSGVFRLMRAGLAAIGTRLSSTAVEYGDYAVLSLMADVRTVGLYFFAFRLSTQALRTLAINLVSVLLPALVRITGDPLRQVEAALTASEAVAFIVMPICFLQVALAAPLLNLIFDPRWSETAIYIQILSAGLPFDALAWPAGALLTAQGRYRLGFVLSLVWAIVFFVLLACGAALDGARGVAISVSLYYVTLGIGMIVVVYRSPSIGLGRILHIVALPFVCSSSAVSLSVLAGDQLAIGSGGKILLVPLLSTVLYYILVKMFHPKILAPLESRVGTLLQANFPFQRDRTTR